MSANILIAGPSWVGDMVMAQSLFIRLKQQRPGCQIDVLAPGWSLPVLARMPEVNELITMPAGHGEISLSARYKLGKSLRVKQYDQAIVVPRSLKAALVPFFAKAKKRTGFVGEQRYGLLNDMRKLDKEQLPRTVQRYVSLGLASNASLPPECPPPVLRVDGDNVAKLIRQHQLPTDRPLVGLMPGAEFGPAKQWPLRYFSEVAQALEKQGVACAIFGSPKDAGAGEAIKAGCPSAFNLCGKTELVDVVDLLSHCSAAVTNDSGLMHVAAAVGTAIVVVYGSTSPTMTPPLTDNAIVLEHELECRPCGQRECPLVHHDCMEFIKPAMVLSSLVNVLNSSR